MRPDSVIRAIPTMDVRPVEAAFSRHTADTRCSIVYSPQQGRCSIQVLGRLRITLPCLSQTETCTESSPLCTWTLQITNLQYCNTPSASDDTRIVWRRL